MGSFLGSLFGWNGTYPKNIPGKTSCQIGDVLPGLVLKSGDVQPLLQKELLVLGMVLQIAVHKVFSRFTRGLEHFAESSKHPWNHSTILRPSLVATLQQTFLP